MERLYYNSDMKSVSAEYKLKIVSK